MSERAGVLLWNRQLLTLQAGANEIDTGLKQVSLAFGDDQPILGIPGAAAPVPGATPASRVMVIVLPPVDGWIGVSIGEPYLNTTTGTVHVVMTNANKTPVDINVLFWDPHTSISPGEADAYNILIT